MKLLYYSASIGFPASLIINLIFVYRPVMSPIMIFALAITGIGMIVVFASMAFMELLSETTLPVKSKRFDVFDKSMPLWPKYVMSTLILYNIMNVALLLSFSGDGIPVRDGREYILEYQGGVQKRISRDEYEMHRAYKWRLLSSYAMIFYFLGYCYFGAYEKRKLK